MIEDITMRDIDLILTYYKNVIEEANRNKEFVDIKQIVERVYALTQKGTIPEYRVNNACIRCSEINNRIEVVQFEQYNGKETCYVLGIFDVRNDGEDVDFTFCYDRPLRLTPDEFADFMQVVKYGYERLAKYAEDAYTAV